MEKVNKSQNLQHAGWQYSVVTPYFTSTRFAWEKIMFKLVPKY